jgi:hypothetical protein
MALAANEFRCSLCRGVFEKGWTDEEADAEFATQLPGIPVEETKLVCDDCYELMGHNNSAVRNCLRIAAAAHTRGDFAEVAAQAAKAKEIAKRRLS